MYHALTQLYGDGCAGQGGNDLLGNRQQNGEQQLRLGNLALVSTSSTIVTISWSYYDY